MGNGASELIDLLIRSINVKSWRPSYCNVQYMEYERCSKSCGLEKKLSNDKTSNLLCIINPNNPTGEYMNLNDLKNYILDNLDHQSNDCQYIIVDESMQPWYGKDWRDDSLVSQTEWIFELAKKNIFIFIIHSWTKFFSCTGLRYGSLICPTEELYNTILSKKVPWSVNILSLRYLDICINDLEYQKRTWELTRNLRTNQINEIIKIFPEWKVYGEDFLSWLWIDTGNEELGNLVYELCKYNGTPIRNGLIGYKMKGYIRIAVREEKYFKILLNAVSKAKTYFKHVPILHHLNIDNKIIEKFAWVNVKDIKIHEKYIEDRHNNLFNYLRSIDNHTIPAIILCYKTNTLIDGHHRLSVLKKCNFEKVPCILINYNNSNILVNVNNNKITKKDVIDSAITGNYLEPKSTCHMVIDSYGVKHPIIVLSPNVTIKLNN